jgi:DNA-directed RNA polymerase subunit RPC12/RpoP
MPLTVPCLKCKTKFQVPSKLAGTTVRCQACGFMLKLPSPEIIQAKKLAPGKKLGKSPASKPVSTSKPTPLPVEEFVGDFFEQSLDFGNGPANATPAPSPAAAPPAPEPTLLSCSHCQGLLYYDPNFANQTVACPHCGNHLVMPEL